METIVRWSPHSTADRRLFILLDVPKSRLQLCKVSSLESKPVQYTILCEREKLPNYTAFDFSRIDRYIVGFGGQSGEATIVQVDPDKSPDSAIVRSFPVRSQRRCNSLAFSYKNCVVTALEKVRNDYGLNIFDLGSLPSTPVSEPARKLALTEGVASVKFFNQQPDLLLAGIHRQSVRIYDLRTNNGNVMQLPTRLVHNLAIDPLDENYFISAGPEKEPAVAVWDRRNLRPASSTPSADGGPQGAALEIRMAVDNSHTCSIHSLRFSGVKRGCFSVLSSSGEVRAFELAQHVPDKRGSFMSLQATPNNPIGGTPWLAQTYARRTHSLSYPIWSPMHPRDEKKRIVSCDFMSLPGSSSDISLLALSLNGQISRMRLHDIPRKVNITALDEIWLWKDKPKVLKQRERLTTSSDELISLQAKASIGSPRRAADSMQSSASRLENLGLESSVYKSTISYESPFYTSSGDKHKDLLTLNFPEFVPSIQDALKVLPIQRRRCEEGYSLDPQKNSKIVSNDPWLVDMWSTISRFNDFAKNDGMFHIGIDLAYLGVYGIWTSAFNTRNRLVGRESFTSAEYSEVIDSIVLRKAYPPFRGHKTKYPGTRQLCLALCGWAFQKEVLRQRCQMLMDDGQYYKAIVVAVMRGFKDLAQDLLKHAIQSKKLQNIGLGAVIACESVNDEQRDLCAWMAEETDDPYLKALLAYFVSGDWKVVADMPLLPLTDRIGCAVKYIDDNRLSDFIKVQTRVAAMDGNTEGLVLTGLAERAVDLFRQYINKFNDLQTAVLALSFSNPVYVADSRFDMWREIYLMQMQHWRAFSERTVYLDLHSRRSKARSGARFGNTPSRPITLRCNHCLNVLAPKPLREKKSPSPPSSLGSSANPISGTLLTVTAPKSVRHSPAAHSGLVCSTCTRPMPHCGICGLLLGNPDPRRTNGAAADVLAKEDPLARQALYCLNCTHVFHGNHARDWFARHKMCPVPDCQCMCGFLH